MEAPVIVAIVAGVASLLSAFIAWKQAERAKRIEVATQEKLTKLTTETQLTIEKMKADNDRLDKAFEAASTEAAPLEVILSQIWQHYQIVKDEIRKLVETRPVDLDYVPTAIAAIKAAQIRLTQLYREHGIELPDSARHVAHEGGHIVSRILVTLDSVNHASRTGERFGPEMLRHLQNDHERLTTIQGIILIERINLRGNQLQRLLEMMSYKDR